MAEVPLDAAARGRLRRRALPAPARARALPAGAGRPFYVEHNAPQGRIADIRHPMADRDDLTLVHVTHFNALFWDAGATPTRVIEHGIVDPGHRYTRRARRAPRS